MFLEYGKRPGGPLGAGGALSSPLSYRVALPKVIPWRDSLLSFPPLRGQRNAVTFGSIAFALVSVRTFRLNVTISGVCLSISSIVTDARTWLS